MKEEKFLRALGTLSNMAIDNTKGSRAVEICVKDIQNYVQQRDNIIKEVREYIHDRYDGEVLTHTFDKDNVKELLEILDKVEENTNGKV